ncbi:MAG TPA: GNAT family N-acetyltransferase [Acidimicrobiales bacterium]|nr:GNAT family N-acetyltransferase [Acidimicrobiales bacterium]
MAESGSPVAVGDAPDRDRYEALVGDTVAGFVTYSTRRGTRVLIHAEVDPAFEGQGVGSRLAAGALDDIRARGLRVAPLCPFMAGYIRRHPEYADLVATA